MCALITNGSSLCVKSDRGHQRRLSRHHRAAMIAAALMTIKAAAPTSHGQMLITSSTAILSRTAIPHRTSAPCHALVSGEFFGSFDIDHHADLSSSKSDGTG